MSPRDMQEMQHPMIDQNEQSVLSEIAERLAQQYPAVPPAVVSNVVRDVHAKFVGRPIRDFVPLFVERDVKAELAKLGV